MAERPLGLVVHFRHGACTGRQIKERIVSETVAASRSGEDAAFNRALCGQQSGAITGSCQHTLIASAAFALRNASELLQQEEIVVAIGSRIGVEAGIGGVAGGANTGSTLECVEVGASSAGGSMASRPGRGRISVSWAAAATAKSRSLPGLLLAT
jgi:hypothetical protein